MTSSVTPRQPTTLRSIPPAAARMCLGIERFITCELEFDPAGKELVLAYSGGADSRALFYVLLCLRPRLNFSLSLAHLDHALRPTSAEERLAAEKLAKNYALPCYSARTEVASIARKLKMGLEEAGRAARLQFLQKLGAESPERWIVYGHQLNDLAEDILLRLIRGSGWPALGGMRALEKSQRLLRPLLFTSRSDIENFLVLLRADWLKDPLNNDKSFKRNRVREEILPLFLRENPSFLKAAANLQRLASFDAEFFQRVLSSHLDNPENPRREKTRIALSRALLDSLPKALRLRLYKSSLEDLGPGQPLLSNLLLLDKALELKKTGTEVQFPGHKRARISRLEIIFSSLCLLQAP
jgi:tRNA(Ile)-lysidine synthase